MARYLSQLDTADQQEPSDVLVLKTMRLKEKLDNLKDEMGKRDACLLAGQDLIATEVAAVSDGLEFIGLQNGLSFPRHTRQL